MFQQRSLDTVEELTDKLCLIRLHCICLANSSRESTWRKKFHLPVYMMVSKYLNLQNVQASLIRKGPQKQES